jgi:hypothetical protein
LSAFYLNNNCGLTFYNTRQERDLAAQDPNWKTQNTDCSHAEVCPLVSISSNFDIHLPHINYNGVTLSANLRYAPRNGKILFEVVDYSINSDSCASANLSPELNLHIPSATFEGIKLWADLIYYPTNDNKILFEVTNYGNA